MIGAITHQKITDFFTRYPALAFKKGATIIQPGDEIQSIYFIQRGYVRMYVVSENGRELTLSIFKPGSYFPFFLVLCSIPNSYTYESFTEVTLRKTPKADVLHFLESNPDVLMEFTSRLSIGLNGILTNMQFLLFGSIENRITSLLHMLSKRFGEIQSDNTLVITLPLTHQDIASMIGATRETTSLELETLVRKHIIIYKKKHVTIMNVQSLEQTVHGDKAITHYSL